MAISPAEVAEEVAEDNALAAFSTDSPWITIVWDDPVNLMTYVHMF